MSIPYVSYLRLSVIAAVVLVGCTSVRQLAVDYPTAETGDSKTQTTKQRPFSPVSGFSVIDGDDYYVRLVSEFEYKGENILKKGCTNIVPSYKEGDFSSALVFSVRNDILKFSNEATGFIYHSAGGKCNFKFDAKKINLTPWMRLDTGKETLVDYSFYSSANSDVDVSGLIGDVTAAGSLLSLTGVGAGVALMGQFSAQWLNNNQQQHAVLNKVKNSSESYSLPAIVTYSGKSGSLNQTVFKVYAVAEGGINILSSDTLPLGELNIYPEIIPSLLLKIKGDGAPNARDLSFDEIGYSPIKTTTGEIKLLDLIQQSNHPSKPNLKPDWSNYADVESNCRKLKLVMKDLGFNKFDRNALIYYFLHNSNDWKNYNLDQKKSLSSHLNSELISSYSSKDFGNCLADDDYVVMKAMGLSVNLPSDWRQTIESSEKKERLFTHLKSIERQLVSVLKNSNETETERQIYPLLATAKNGDGTVLLQNHLGDFGLEQMLNAPPATEVKSVKAAAVPATIPGEGLVVSAHQLVQVFSGLSLDKLSCARPVPNQQVSNMGILLFTTKEGSPWAKGGAMEFEFASGKINRISFQLPSFRDFKQDLLNHPEIAGCKIDSSFVDKLH
ncbi:hypothetical protein [Nitrosomonas sp. Is37]|uniref:hypothetical protein n=1 Tax=Nitrosomonas sp. Is37 TaxID=3080535 RepID=UPI00294B1E77|nr:hypothetical protein [Nitrosomonas sp. Is37]MDV6343498.1 hypothetical protein [Nitrosomonas sp. Is37]